jgi:hypothetical protein
VVLLARLDVGLDVGCSLVRLVLLRHGVWLLRLESNLRFVGSQCIGRGYLQWRMLLLDRLVSCFH